MGFVGTSYISTKIYPGIDTGYNSKFRSLAGKCSYRINQSYEYLRWIAGQTEKPKSMCELYFQVDFLQSAQDLNSLLAEHAFAPAFDEESVRGVIEYTEKIMQALADKYAELQSASQNKRSFPDWPDLKRTAEAIMPLIREDLDRALRLMIPLRLKANFLISEYSWYYRDYCAWDKYYDGYYIELKVDGKDRKFRTETEDSFHYITLEKGCRITWVNRQDQRELVFPNRLLKNVTSLRGISCAFMSVESVKLPIHLADIYPMAFAGCASLKEILFPDTLETIDLYAFACCSALTSVVIPASIRTIDSMAFAMCTNLKSVIIKNPQVEIAADAFFGCDEVEIVFEQEEPSLLYQKDSREITLPEGLTELPDNFFYGFELLENVVLPMGLQRIGAAAFFGCRNLTELILPESVEEIGESAFAGCSSLSRIVLPKKLSGIGTAAFADCTSLTSVKLPEGITEIAEDMFSECHQLAELTIPEGVIRIGKHAFAECSLLKELTLPASVEDIVRNALEYTNIETLTLLGQKTVLTPDSLHGVPKKMRIVNPVNQYPETDAQYEMGFILSGGTLLTLTDDSDEPIKSAYDRTRYFALAREAASWTIQVTNWTRRPPEPRRDSVSSRHVTVDNVLVKGRQLYGVYFSEPGKGPRVVSFEEAREPFSVYSGTYYFDEPGDHDSWNTGTEIQLVAASE